MPKKGNIPWNKGKTGIQKAWNKGRKLSVEHIQNLSKAKLENPVRYWLGKKRPNLDLSSRILPTGDKHWHWKGGITPISERLRRTPIYKAWRKAVYERDDYTCRGCGERGGKLNADHILPFSLFEAVRFDINNGRTLCVPCHKNMGWKYRPIAKAEQA